MWLVAILVVLAVLFAIYFAIKLTFLAIALIPWIIIGLIVGWIASAIMRSPHGIVGDTLIGLAGSVIGGVLYAILFHGAGGLLNPLHFLASIVGAVIVVAVVKAVNPGPALPPGGDYGRLR